MNKVLPEVTPVTNPEVITGKIRLIYGDITAQNDVDAIATCIPSSLDMSGSLNRAIMAAAGHRLDRFILEHIFKPNPGDVFAVPGFDLPVKHVFVTIIPAWKSDIDREDRDLVRCYRAAMEMARSTGITKIAFPPMGMGRNHFPLARAARLALQGIGERMTDKIAEVRIVCNVQACYDAFRDHLLKE